MRGFSATGHNAAAGIGPAIETLPMADDAERAFIGWVINEGRLPPVDLSTEDFGNFLNRDIYRAFAELDADGERIDPIAAKAILERNGSSVTVAEMMAAAAGVPFGTSPDSLVRQIRDAAERRRLIKAMNLYARQLADRSIEPGEIVERIKGLVPDADQEEFSSLFALKTANEWIMNAKDRPTPRRLFDEFWFEGETAILFGDTGKGKSILAVQIGESAASGRPISGFDFSGTAQKVLVFDFELSDKQFEGRYSEKQSLGEFNHNHYRFSDNFVRAEIDPNASMPQAFKTFEDYLSFSLEYHLAETEAKILIVDNLTYLRQETERSKDALPLMKELKRLKARYGLSILALAHTPKRDLTRPITVNDLAGSKMLANFADSVFAIGESAKDPGLRYLKQIKTRSAETKYHAENVVVCQIGKPQNFLRLEFKAFGTEAEHLRELSDRDRTAIANQAKTLHGEGRTQREIADELGVSQSTVNRLLK